MLAMHVWKRLEKCIDMSMPFSSRWKAEFNISTDERVMNKGRKIV